MVTTIWKFLALLRQVRRAERIDHEELMNAVIEASNSCVGLLALNVLSAKHPSFSEEKEWRAIALMDEEKAPPLLSVRISKTIFAPYLPLKLRIGESYLQDAMRQIRRSQHRVVVRGAVQRTAPSGAYDLWIEASRPLSRRCRGRRGCLRGRRRPSGGRGWPRRRVRRGR